jgi:hypothetical protein
MSGTFVILYGLESNDSYRKNTEAHKHTYIELAEINHSKKNNTKNIIKSEKKTTIEKLYPEKNFNKYVYRYIR